MIRHIVVFTLRDDTRGELDSLLADLRGLPERVPGIVALTCGTNVASSGHDGALVVDLADRDAFAAYRDHPEHQPVSRRLRELASRVEVADIET